MLEIKDLTITYEGNVALNQITFTVKEGEIVSVVGESGSGKTTLLKAILGLLPTEGRITQGEVFYKHTPLLNSTANVWNQIRGKELAMVFQDAGLSFNPVRKIGKQFIEYIRTHQSMSKQDAHELALKMLKKVNLDHGEQIMNSYMFNLSGGMKQRVGLAMALSLEPSVLLLDEATSALDATTQMQVVNEILELRKEFKSSVLMITHDLALALHMSDKIVVMKKGKVVEINSTAEILNHPQHEYTKQLLENMPRLEAVNK